MKIENSKKLTISNELLQNLKKVKRWTLRLLRIKVDNATDISKKSRMVLIILFLSF